MSHYRVESILNHRLNAKSNSAATTDQKEYLIKWEGYSTQECTWEPIKNLSTIKEMVTEYDQKHQTKQSASSKQLNSRIEEKKGVTTKTPSNRGKKGKSLKIEAMPDSEEEKISRSSC